MLVTFCLSWCVLIFEPNLRLKLLSSCSYFFAGWKILIYKDKISLFHGRQGNIWRLLFDLQFFIFDFQIVPLQSISILMIFFLLKNVKTLVQITTAYLGPCHTSITKLFCENSKQLLINFAQSSTTDILEGPEYATDQSKLLV